MTNEASSNAIIGNTLRIIASGEYHPGAELTQKMASYIIELEQKLTDMAVQLANAESKCRELAAENEKRNTHSEALAVDNAALREVVERMVNQFAMSGISPEEKSINPAKSLMFDAKSALFMPATDAYLAEVRASGVEMFGQYHNFSEKLFIQKESKKFAAQIRKGVQS